MARLVARKRFTSKKGDLPMVIALNTRTILSIFRDMKVLKYMDVGWGDDEAVQLAEVLPLCTSATELHLSFNKISDRGAKALAAAFAEGAMPNLEVLDLGRNNQIGDEGAKALAEAVGKGALPKLEEFRLFSNQIGDNGAKALAEAIGKGAMPELKDLNLGANQIGDEGTVALAAAFAEGAMPKLEILHLGDNRIGDEGAVALAEAVGKGALPGLKKLDLRINKLFSQTAKDAWKAVKAKRSGLTLNFHTY